MPVAKKILNKFFLGAYNERTVVQRSSSAREDMTMTKEVALFVPVFEEEETLGSILEQLPSKMKDGAPVSLYVVDDGSQDGSAEVARDFTDNVIVLPKNKGVGAATKAGLQKITQDGGVKRFSCVIKFDADGQHDIRLIPAVYKLLRDYDVVTCSRFHPVSDQSSTPLDRLILNMTFANIFKVITGVQLSDVRTGFMGLRMRHVERIADKLIVERYGIPMELLIRVWSEEPQANFCEVPHPAMYQRDISSKLNAKYTTEDLELKSRRVADAYCAILRVLADLQMDLMDIMLKKNGFSSVEASAMVS